MSNTVATLTLKDLGATLTLQSDGSAQLSKGWFENLSVSTIDVLEIQAFLNANLGKVTNK